MCGSVKRTVADASEIYKTIKQLEHNGEIKELKKGERNEFNIPYSDGFELVTNSISNIIGQNFFGIEPNHTFHRYRITDEKFDIRDIAIDKINWFERLKELEVEVI